MEIAKIICCTISFITVFLGGLYILNRFMHHLFEYLVEEKRLEKLNTQTVTVKTEKEKQEENLKYIIEKIKDKENINMEKYLNILIELNQKPRDEQTNN